MENASTVQFQKIYFGAFAVKRQIQITVSPVRDEIYRMLSNMAIVLMWQISWLTFDFSLDWQSMAQSFW